MARTSKEDEDPLVRVKQYVESHNIKVRLFTLLHLKIRTDHHIGDCNNFVKHI